MLLRRMNVIVRREEKEALKKETIALLYCLIKDFLVLCTRLLKMSFMYKDVSKILETIKTASNFA